MTPILLLAEVQLIQPALLPPITAWAVFLVVFLILWKKVWPTVSTALEDRNNKIVSEIEAAEQARKDAKAAQAEFERKLGEAQQQATLMIRQAQAEALRAGEELRSKIETELSERQRRAAEEIEAARRSAVATLEAQAADLAVAVASRILQREINAGDQRALINDSIRQLATSRN